MNAFGVVFQRLWVKKLLLFNFSLRFQNFYPLNNCKTRYLSDGKKRQGLANMSGGVAVPSQTRVFFLWQFLKYVVWRCHAENIFCHQTSLVKRLQTQVFLVECGTWWCSMWCFLGAAPHILRLLHNDKYKAYHFWPENHVLVLVLAYDQIIAIDISFKR